jgi:multiple sugar transport system substrate-binding protein
MKKFWKLTIAFGAVAASAALLGARGTAQAGWTVTEAAKPYAGTTIKAVYLDRPGYKAAAKLVPEFEKLTGIKVENEVIPYENTREKMVLDFTSKAGTYDVALTDVVWVGEYAANGWLTPLEKFTSDPKLADPALNLKGFIRHLGQETLRHSLRQLRRIAVLQPLHAREGRIQSSTQNLG